MARVSSESGDTLDLLCAVLRNERVAWPVEAAGTRLFDTARQHGVHLLIADRVSQRGRMDGCPPPLRERLATAICNQVAIDEIAVAELRRVLRTFGDNGIAPLLFKGAALAYSHYPDPTLRPRVDADVLVDTNATDLVQAILERMEYQKLPFVTGDLVMHQAPYVRTDSRGVHHAIDVHWRISNPRVFAGAVTIAELRARAIGIPALGDAARAVGPAHALAIACIHRVAHHSDEERLIWLYDIHLIAERLTPAEQDELVQLARTKQLTLICAAGLEAALERFHGDGAAALLVRMGGSTREPSGIYVRGPMRKVDVLVSDLNALEGWRPKMRLLRQHVLPSPSYMRQGYGISHPALLPLAYVWRFVRGAREWWRAGRDRDQK